MYGKIPRRCIASEGTNLTPESLSLTISAFLLLKFVNTTTESSSLHICTLYYI